MSSRYEKLKKVENQINELCLLRRLKIEAEHRKRIKCIKTLRLYMNCHCDTEGMFIRIDSRVINDFKNSEVLKMSDLVERAYFIFGDIKTMEEINEVNGEDINEITREKFNTVQIDSSACLQRISPMINEVSSTESINFSKELEDCKEEGSCINSMQITNDNETPIIFEWISQDEKVDCFELRVPGHYQSCKLVLVLKNKREIYKLSPLLSSLLSLATSSKPNLIGSLYTYIIKNSLFDKEYLLKHSDYLVKSNEKLKKVFQKNKFLFSDLPELVEDHLYPLDDIVIDVSSLTLDIPIEVDDLFQHPKVHQKDVYLLEKKIDTINEIKSNLEKRKEILKEFSSNPISFINKWICLDLEEFSNKTGVFKDDHVRDIIYELLKEVV